MQFVSVLLITCSRTAFRSQRDTIPLRILKSNLTVNVVTVFDFYRLANCSRYSVVYYD